MAKYAVIIEKFAEQHYIKTFNKKYGRAWDITLETLVREFQSFDVLFERNIAKTIIDSADIKICKAEFKVAGTNESRHGSGSRCIVALNKVKSTVSVLLVYGKTDIGGGKETATWKNILRENYPEYKNL
ncbi:MAG: hypothetical protein MUD10_05575, partial [Candidatus Pacebacteria bacterium]|nr:hypothetical protein [Candidatus Paceibacterota bacterium]